MIASSGSAATVHRLDPFGDPESIALQSPTETPADTVMPPETTGSAAPARSVSPSKPLANSRAEAEARERAAATRRHALQLVQEEEERTKCDELKRGLVLSVRN